ncbi:MAG: Rpn family recombination-promoting nuclease/putative transposase [Methanobacteriaceae archaeon]|jgi:predicted transposase/invertase (TIGR01784 family)|nr:Rpn family recombination-promoting nuclease/putative transposase [Candidatus Methanorudis spinitermitis]
MVVFDPMNDFLFSKFMGSEGCEKILLSFFNSVFQEVGIKVMESVDIVDNKFISADIKGNKSCILDLRSVDSYQRKVNMELQNRDSYHFVKRSMLYIAREISSSAKEGNFKSLTPHVLINLLNYNFCKGSAYSAKFNIVDIKNIDCVYSDLITIVNVDMVAFRRLKKNIDLNNPLHRWLIFFDKQRPKKIVNKVISMDDNIKLAEKKIKEVLSDEQALHDYYMRELAKMEYISDMETSKEKGMKKGKKEEKLEIASKLKSKGISLEIIAETTNIPISKLKKL